MGPKPVASLTTRSLAAHPEPWPLHLARGRQLISESAQLQQFVQGQDVDWGSGIAVVLPAAVRMNGNGVGDRASIMLNQEQISELAEVFNTVSHFNSLLHRSLLHRSSMEWALRKPFNSLLPVSK